MQISFLALPYLFLAVFAKQDPALVARDFAVQRFEERFLNTLDWQHSNTTLKLVGYKRIIMSPEQLQDLEHHIENDRPGFEEFSNAFYDSHEKALRVYFPVEGALMFHDGQLIEANYMGEHPNHNVINGDYSIVGRYQTPQLHGTSHNDISDGIVWLRDQAYPSRRYGDNKNILVYDFGWRDGPHEHSNIRRDESEDEDKGGDPGSSCVQNHGDVTCSQAYNIHKGRCYIKKGGKKVEDFSDCRDYNGWPIKNCNNHSDKKAFVGSDCFWAVASGHCWNEVGRAIG